MSNLQKEWTDLIINRGAGGFQPSNAVKIQQQFAKEIKSAAERQNPVLARIRPEFEVLRRQAKQSFEQNIPVQERKFKFGLGLQQPASVPDPHDPKPQTKHYGIEAIAEMSDTPLDSEGHIDIIQDRLEVNSIAHKASRVGRHIETAETEISYLQDLSPMTISLTNLRAAEEVMLLGGTSSSVDGELLLARRLQITDLNGIEEENMDEEDITHFVMGRIPRTKLGAKLYRANGDLVTQIKNRSSSPIAQSTREASRTHTFPPITTPGLQTVSDTEKENDDNSLSLQSRSIEIDDRIQDIYDGIKSDSPDMQKTSSISQAMGKLDTENMTERQKFKTKLLFQFIKEYKKLKDEKSTDAGDRIKRPYKKPAVPRVSRPVVKKSSEATIELDPSVYYYNSTDQSPKQEGITTTIMRTGWQTGKPVQRSTPRQAKTPTKRTSKAANLGYKVNSRANRHVTPTKSSIGKTRPQIQEKQVMNNSGWIGGSAHSRDEFEDSNWVSVNDSWTQDELVKDY